MPIAKPAPATDAAGANVVELDPVHLLQGGTGADIDEVIRLLQEAGYIITGRTKSTKTRKIKTRPDAVRKGAVRCFVVKMKNPTEAAAVAHVVRALPVLIQRARRRLDEQAIETLTEFFVEQLGKEETQTDLERENAQLRAAFLTKFQCLTSQEVHQRSGSASRNAAMTAHRWKQQRRIFSIPHRGQDLFPAFQFRDGAPRPAIKRILGALPTGIRPWETAFWFVSGNGWLGNRAPVDCLDDAEAVVGAAMRERETVVG